MSLWTKAQQLQGEALRQVQAVYGEHFPIEVRHFLAPWIESKIMSDVDPDNPQHEQYAASVVGALIQELESKAQALTNEEFFLTKIKLQGAAEMFRQRYSQNPLGLLRIIRHCLGTELKLVQQAENMSLGMSSNPAALLPDASGEILQQLDILRQRTQETSEDLRRMEQEQEAFALEYHELTKIQANLTHLQNQAPSQQKNDFEKQLRIKKEMSEHKLNVKLAELLQMRMALAEKHKETLMLIENLQARVLDDELIRWKREQQLAGNGVPFHSNLDSIQEWCEGLAEIIWLNRQQIKEAERLRAKFPIMQANNTDHVPALNTQITQLLSSLVTSTFIIERQPPQVMKTNTRFTAMVRLLVGGKLNVHMTPPQVTVSIISEQQANTLLKNDKMAKGEASGEILNNTGTMEYQKASRQLSVSFRNMQLRKIKRAEKKGTESVMDEKFSLLFQSKFSVGGGELVFQVWTLSLPVVVIVHGNQEPHAWATVTWDNAFAEPGRTPFVVPEKVPWSQVAETLSTKFRSATGRALTESNQRFLASKAFRNPNLQLPLVGPEAGNLMLTWSQFCKEPLYESNFTFWEWFYALMKLTREHLRAPWMDNTIVGFIGRKQTEDLLKQCLRGTFMLRFSDSELGGVTIAWVGDSSEVFMLQPFTSKDFAIRTLADRVSDLKHLIYLYPDIPKDQAFGKYYTPFTDSQTPTNGYVKPLLVTHVPGWSSGGGNLETGSYPPTPQGFYNPQVLPTTEWQLSPRRSDYVLSYVGRNGRAMSYGTIQPYLDSRKHLKLQTGHTVTVIALHGQRIQISCSVINLTSSGSYLEFREKDGDIAKQPVINRVYTSKSNTMAVYSQIVKDADWFNCKWKTTDSYPIHKLCRDIEAKTINGAIQSMDLAEESHRFCTFSIVVPLDQHVQISCSVVSLASGCGLKFHEERGWMNEAGLISTRPIIDRNYTSKGNKMFIQADSFDNKRCRFDCTWKTTTTPTYRLCFYKRAKSLNGTIQPLDDAGMDGPRFCPFTITAARTDQLIRISCSVVKLTTVLSSLRFYDGRDAGANVIAYPPIANKVYTSKGNTLVVFSWKFDDDWFDCEWATVQASS